MQQQSDPYVYEKAHKIITDYLRLKPDELQPDSHIVDDMGADSLALVELGFQILNGQKIVGGGGGRDISAAVHQGGGTWTGQRA